MYEIKPTKNNPQELCILTNPKQHGVVNMYQIDQPICSESRLEALRSAISHIESIHLLFIEESEINDNTYDIIYDKDDESFPGRDIFQVLDKLDDWVLSKIEKINILSGRYQMTKSEVCNSREEFDEPENQSPFGAGFPSLDFMGDI